jgi:hypothetical protein
MSVTLFVLLCRLDIAGQLEEVFSLNERTSRMTHGTVDGTYSTKVELRMRGNQISDPCNQASGVV